MCDGSTVTLFSNRNSLRCCWIVYSMDILFYLFFICIYYASYIYEYKRKRCINKISRCELSHVNIAYGNINRILEWFSLQDLNETTSNY